MASVVKWGVLGCAGIAAKTCEGMREARNTSCIAVGSRDVKKAEAFASANCPGAKAYGSYQEVLDNPDVQVVYIPLPTSMKPEWVKKAAAAGKHILCEKPLAGTTAEAKEMLEAVAAAGVQFMDNTMFMHHERTAAVEEAVKDPELFGETRQVTSSFTVPFGNDEAWSKGPTANIRMKRDQEPLGCMGDLGWYNIRLTSVAFGYEEPTAVSCTMLEATDEGVPTYCLGTMKYSNGRIGRFDCSFVHPLRQWGEIAGVKSSIWIPDFVVTHQKDRASFTVTTATIGEKAITFPSEVKKEPRFYGCVQHTRLVEKMSNIVASGKLEPKWPEVSLQTQSIMGALLRSAQKDGAWVNPAEENDVVEPSSCAVL